MKKGGIKGLKQAPKQEHLSMLQELVNNIPDVIYFKDKEGRLILVNKAHAEGLGLTPEEVVGKTDFDFFPKEQAELMTKDDNVVMQTGCPIVDVIERTTQPNGSQHIVSTTKVPRKDKFGNIIGIMGVTRDVTERVRQEEERLLERKRANEEMRSLKYQLETEKRKLEEVLSIEEELNKIVNKDKLIQFVVSKTLEILGANRCSIMLMDKKSRQLNVGGSQGIEKDKISKYVSDNKNSISYTVCQLGVPILVSDIESDQRFQRRNRSSYKSKSFLCVPIKLGDEVLGVINVSDKQSKEGNVFTQLDLKILSTFASHVAVAVENANLYKKLNFLAISDPLTNMYNYRHFAKSLDQEIIRMQRYTEDLCLLMIDVDDFKVYNDKFGHLEGDHLLKEVSQALNKSLRSIDIACRYAGDEFVVILPKTQLEQSQLVAQKILSSVNNLKLKSKISLSIGVAQWRKDMDRHLLTLKADSALYEAKKSGKNKVCAYSQ